MASLGNEQTKMNFTAFSTLSLLQLVLLLSALIKQTISYSTFDEYHLLYRQLAILRFQETMRHRSRILLPSEVNSTYLSDKPRWITKYTLPCPDITDIINDDAPGRLEICPSDNVLDFDVYRNPMIMFQVKCRCLKCQVLWFETDTKMCEPLFEMKKVERVVDITEHGDKVFAQVWEPVSYACACRRKPGRRRHVMPP
ncbi:hypothetical protein ACF0H5_017249 [Mactra antiquata]